MLSFVTLLLLQLLALVLLDFFALIFLGLLAFFLLSLLLGRLEFVGLFLLGFFLCLLRIQLALLFQLGFFVLALLQGNLCIALGLQFLLARLWRRRRRWRP